MDKNMPPAKGYTPAKWEKIFVYIVATALLGVICFLMVRNQPFTDPNLVVFARICLSLAAASLGATIPGFLNIEWTGRGFAVRAGGALALFVLTFWLTPRVLTPGISVITMDAYRHAYVSTDDRTNSDEIYDALKEIKPIHVMKEATNLRWDRQEALRALNPALIVIHVSAFSDTPRASPGSQDALKRFITYMTNTRTQFLFYSRALSYDPGDIPSLSKENEMADYIATATGCPRERAHVFMFPPDKPYDFSNLDVQAAIRQRVMTILSI